MLSRTESASKERVLVPAINEDTHSTVTDFQGCLLRQLARQSDIQGEESIASASTGHSSADDTSQLLGGVCDAGLELRLDLHACLVPHSPHQTARDAELELKILHTLHDNTFTSEHRALKKT